MNSVKNILIDPILDPHEPLTQSRCALNFLRGSVYHVNLWTTILPFDRQRRRVTT